MISIRDPRRQKRPIGSPQGQVCCGYRSRSEDGLESVTCDLRLSEIPELREFEYPVAQCLDRAVYTLRLDVRIGSNRFSLVVAVADARAKSRTRSWASAAVTVSGE